MNAWRDLKLKVCYALKVDKLCDWISRCLKRIRPNRCKFCLARSEGELCEECLSRAEESKQEMAGTEFNGLGLQFRAYHDFGAVFSNDGSQPATVAIADPRVKPGWYFSKCDERWEHHHEESFRKDALERLYIIVQPGGGGFLPAHDVDRCLELLNELAVQLVGGVPGSGPDVRADN